MERTLRLILFRLAETNTDGKQIKALFVAYLTK